MYLHITSYCRLTRENFNTVGAGCQPDGEEGGDPGGCDERLGEGGGYGLVGAEGAGGSTAGGKLRVGCGRKVQVRIVPFCTREIRGEGGDV